MDEQDRRTSAITPFPHVKSQSCTADHIVNLHCRASRCVIAPASQPSDPLLKNVRRCPLEGLSEQPSKISHESLKAAGTVEDGKNSL